MNREQLISALAQYGSSPEEACFLTIGVRPEQVRQKVVLAPWWLPTVFDGLGEDQYLSHEAVDSIRVWDFEKDGQTFTYVRAGIGAPVTSDVLLALGLTPCQEVLFVGSAGALSPEMAVGDVVVPEYSICGDGASRYIAGDSLQTDVFGERVYPDPALTARLNAQAEKACAAYGVTLHKGRNFSVDTIFAQFAHLDEIMAMGCNVIEMETAAVFRGARLMDMAAAALFIITDNSVCNNSLMTAFSPEETAWRRRVRREAFPRMIWGTLFGR